MLQGYDLSLNDRLREAEDAEKEMLRLRPVAATAPRLRLEKVKEQKRKERERNKHESIEIATKAAKAASAKQTQVPSLLSAAGNAVHALYTALKEIDRLRREAGESIAIVDRIEYECEVEEGEAKEIAMDRDPKGLAYVIAARHGDARVKTLLEEIDPGFSYLKDCEMSHPLYRAVAKFVMDHAIASATPAASPPNNG